MQTDRKSIQNFIQFYNNIIFYIIYTVYSNVQQNLENNNHLNFKKLLILKSLLFERIWLPKILILLCNIMHPSSRDGILNLISQTLLLHDLHNIFHSILAWLKMKGCFMLSIAKSRHEENLCLHSHEKVIMYTSTYMYLSIFYIPISYYI